MPTYRQITLSDIEEYLMKNGISLFREAPRDDSKSGCTQYQFRFSKQFPLLSQLQPQQKIDYLSKLGKEIYKCYDSQSLPLPPDCNEHREILNIISALQGVGIAQLCEFDQQQGKWILIKDNISESNPSPSALEPLLFYGFDQQLGTWSLIQNNISESNPSPSSSQASLVSNGNNNQR